MTDLGNALKITWVTPRVWTTLMTAVGLSVLTYALNGSLIRLIAVAILIFAFEAVQRLFEIKQGLPRRPLWERQVVSPHFPARVIQALIATVWWALIVYLMGSFDNVRALLVGTALFGTCLFLFAEWEAWRTRR